MIVFIQSVLSLIFFNEFLYFIFEDLNFNLSSFYILYFIFMLNINFFFNDLPNKFRIDIDLIFKFFLFFIKTPNFLLNYFVNTLKKIYIYLFFFKYRNFFNTTYIFWKKNLKNLFLIWRPLFKKTSYFGFFRSNRSKWIK